MFPYRIDPLIKQIRRLFKFYKRAMRYKGITMGEIGAFSDIIFHAISIVTLLKVYGIRYSKVGVAIACVVVILVLSAIGKLLVIWGVVRYGNEITHEDDPWEDRLKRIEDKLDKK